MPLLRVTLGVLLSAAVLLGCNEPRIGDECDPNSQTQGVCGTNTGFSCVQNRDGTNGCVERGYDCQKVCVTDSDCKLLFGCEQASCLSHTCGGPKICAALESGTSNPCPRQF